MSARRILVVDDNPVELLFAQSILKRRNCWQIDTASNGREALERLDEQTADIVLTDLMMPEIDGLELLEAVQERFPATAVVIMTSRGSEEIAVKALKNGAASYLTKRKMANQLDRILDGVLKAASCKQTQSQLLSHLANSEITFALPNDRELISSAIQFLQFVSLQTGIVTRSERTRIGIALEETLSNAMIHGNLEISSSLREREDNTYRETIAVRKHSRPFCDRMIHVTGRLQDAHIEFTVRDEGPGFDVSSIPDPTDPETMIRPHGRGLFMIHQIMDEVRHNASGNEITLVKRSKAGTRSTEPETL